MRSVLLFLVAQIGKLIAEKGGTIRGSINLPAQSVYNSLPTLLNICKASKIDTVVWYCGK